MSQREIVLKIYEALKEKGYSPERQLVGFLLTGDPTYITAHNGARQLSNAIDVDALMAEIVEFYFQKNQ